MQSALIKICFNSEQDAKVTRKVMASDGQYGIIRYLMVQINAFLKGCNSQLSVFAAATYCH